MASCESHMQRLECALQKGEHVELDLESLRQIELGGATPPRPPQKLRLATHEAQIEEAIERCSTNRRDVFLCDLDAIDGFLPSLEQLKRDNDLAAVWNFINVHRSVHPMITLRHDSPQIPPPLFGEFNLAEAKDSCEAAKACLIIRPGRPSLKQYQLYLMSRVTSYSDFNAAASAPNSLLISVVNNRRQPRIIPPAPAPQLAKSPKMLQIEWRLFRRVPGCVCGSRGNKKISRRRSSAG